MKNFKVTMVNAAGAVVGCLSVPAHSEQQAMRIAEERYPKFAAYTAEPLAPFDYSCVGGMMAAGSAKDLPTVQEAKSDHGEWLPWARK